MFCSKCGKPVTGSNKLCEECSKAAQATEPEPESKPEASESKKKKKTKIIIISAVIAVAVFLVLLFTVIIPSLSNKNIVLADYCTIRFDGVDYKSETVERKVAEGKIEGHITWDTKKLAEKLDIDESEAKDVGMQFDSIFKIESTLNGKPFDYDFTDAHKDDTIKITVHWAGDGETPALSESDQKMFDDSVNELESKYDIKFERETTSTEIKISDALDEQNIGFRELVEFDLLGYIQEHNFIETSKDSRDESYDVDLGEFEFEEVGYTFEHERGYSNIAVSEGKAYIGGVSFKFSQNAIGEGSTEITLSLDEEDVKTMEAKGIKFTIESITFTVTEESDQDF